HQRKPQWHNITLYHTAAEIAGQYLRKGSLVYLEGKIQTNKYVGKVKPGTHRNTNIVCDIMKKL
ncbi:single-stranded DNA-binding protein, partial [Kingella kingae]|uniref:single-stranded DNA-binding protein n=1 Tax=Kingella kingae TaxID=504 RepID=UPI000571C89E